MVITHPAGGAAPDAINNRYPTLWSGGAGLGALEYSARGPFGEEKWRLYRIKRPNEPTGGVELTVAGR